MPFETDRTDPSDRSDSRRLRGILAAFFAPAVLIGRRDVHTIDALGGNGFSTDWRSLKGLYDERRIAGDGVERGRS
jgi:hypothetical protein